MPEETAVVEPPVETKTEPLPNPVIPEGIDLSKQIFREQMEAQKVAAPEPEATPETKETPEVVTPTPPTPEPETKEETKPDEERVEAPAKSALPEELISGKKPEPKVDDAIAEIDAMVLPKNAKPEQVASFAKLKEQAKKVIEEKVTRIRELETKTSDGATRAEIEAAQERVKASEARAKELESTIERLAFTESPKFKQFLTEEAASLSGAKAYFEGTEINPEIIEVAARSAGANRTKVLTDAGADANLIAAVSPYLAQYDAIQRGKLGALENWKVEATQLAEAQKAQQEAAIAQRRASEDKVWDATIAKFETELVPYLKFDKNDPWNARSDELKARAKQVFNGEGISLDEVADTIAKGVAYDALDEVRVALTKEIKKLSTENSKLKSAKPNGGLTTGVPPKPSDEGLSFIDAGKKTFNEEMAKARGG